MGKAWPGLFVARRERVLYRALRFLAVLFGPVQTRSVARITPLDNQGLDGPITIVEKSVFDQVRVGASLGR